MKHLYLLILFISIPLRIFAENFYYSKDIKSNAKVSFKCPKDYFVEAIYHPNLKEATELKISLEINNHKIKLFHQNNNLELIFNEKVVGYYPFYYAGYFSKTPKADTYHIWLQKKGDLFFVALEGEIFAQFVLPKTKNSPIAFSSTGKLSNLRISSGSIDKINLKQRSLDRWRNRTPGVRIPNPVVAPPTLEKLPVVDGKLDKNLASNLTKLYFRSMAPKTYNVKGKADNYLLIGKKDNELYLFWQLEKKSPKKPIFMGGRDKGLWNVESVEFFLVPPKEKDFYQFIFSTAGEIYDAKGSNRAWNGQIKYATSVKGKYWYGEVIISTGKANLPALKENAVWKMDFFASLNWEAWSPAGSYLDKNAYGNLLVIKDAPVIIDDSIKVVSNQSITVSKYLYTQGELDPIVNKKTIDFSSNQRKKNIVNKPLGIGTFITEILVDNRAVYKQGEIYNGENVK